MTAGGEHAGLHKRWLERKLEIEVGKVQAKLLSKGLTVPVPDAETLETGARLAHSHLPKLHVELYGRNPNGTLKAPPDQPNNGPAPPATLVQKLDRLLNPSLLTAIPDDVAAAHGLPIPSNDGGDASGGIGGEGRGGVPAWATGRSAMHLPLNQLSAHGKQTSLGASGAGGGGTLSMPASQRQAGAGGDPSGGSGLAGGASANSVAPPRTARSPQPQLNLRPDLQGADARIDDAMVEVQRIAMQANEMSPRDRVLYLAKQANPNFSLPLPRNAILVGIAPEQGRSRRELLRKGNSRRFTSFSADPNAGASARQLQASPSRRSYINPEGRKSAATSFASRRSSGGGTLVDGTLPPLGTRSRSVGRSSSGSPDPASLEPVESASELKADAEPEGLPHLSPSGRPGEAGAGDQGSASRAPSPRPRLPPVHRGAETAPAERTGAAEAKIDAEKALIWGAVAAAHAVGAVPAPETGAAPEAAADGGAAAAAVAAEPEAGDGGQLLRTAISSPRQEVNQRPAASSRGDGGHAASAGSGWMP